MTLERTIIYLCIIISLLIGVAGAAYRYGYSNGLEEGFNEGWFSRTPTRVPMFYNCSFFNSGTHIPPVVAGGGSGGGDP